MPNIKPSEEINKAIEEVIMKDNEPEWEARQRNKVEPFNKPEGVGEWTEEFDRLDVIRNENDEMIIE